MERTENGLSQLRAGPEQWIERIQGPPSYTCKKMKLCTSVGSYEVDLFLVEFPDKDTLS